MKGMDHEGLLTRLGAGRRGDVPPMLGLGDWMAMGDGTVTGVEVRLAQQVGPAWSGIGGLSPDRLPTVMALVDRHPDGVSVEDACAAAARKHAYETGVILAVASACDATRGATGWGERTGRDPVLRAMAAGWGRPSLPVESFGAVAHWLAERGAGKPLPEPRVDVAAGLLVARAALEAPPARRDVASWP